MTERSRALNPSYDQIWRSIPVAQPGLQLSAITRPAWWMPDRRIGIRPGFPAPAAVRRSRMDDVVNRMARELSDAIAAAVSEDPRIEACRERARAAGFEMKVSLEAVIGFMNRTTPGALAKISTAPQKAARAAERRNFEISANDKRFLRSLRIAADETQEKEVE